MIRHLLTLLAVATAVPVSAEQPESIASRVPQQHYDSFVNECHAKGAPLATCNCIAFEMIKSGRDGEVMLDIAGLKGLKMTDAAAERNAVIATLVSFPLFQSENEEIGDAAVLQGP